MSDRYRLLTGPRGARTGPAGPLANSGPGSTYHNPNPQGPRRYKDRDNYRSSGDVDRPSGPSGPSGQKRSYSDSRGPAYNKRRDYTHPSLAQTERDGLERGARPDRIDRDRPERIDRIDRDKPERPDRPERPERPDRNDRNDRNDRFVRIDRDREAWDSRDKRDSRDAWSRDRDSRYRDPRDSRPSRDYREYRDRIDRDGPEKARFREDRRPDKPDSNPINTESAPENAKTPKGPRVGDKKLKDVKKVARAPPPPRKKPAPRLRIDQTYSLFSARPIELYDRVLQVGEGTYGKVYKARNDVTGEYVALKRLRLELEREGFPLTAMREIKLLQSFEHPNIVGLLEMMVENNQITMIFDYLDHDLTGLLTLPDLVLSEGHRKMIFKQLMDGLHYLHKRRVIHRDIKGSNILLNLQGVLKIADFGLARNMKVLRAGESPDYTNRVITIWYRPPELLMGSTDYGREVDVWGVGCLLIELYIKTAIFQGTEEMLQLYKIYEVLGTPTNESWPDIENLPWFEMLKPRINCSLRFELEYRPQMSADSFDLAQKMLTLNPALRISAEDALKHPYFHNDPKPEPLTFMETLEGEWHEFETKKRRREERKRLHDLKQKQKEMSEPPTQPRADAPATMPLSVGDLTATEPRFGTGDDGRENGLSD